MKVVLEAGYSGYFLDTDRYVKLLLVLLYIINQLKWRYWYLIREYFAILERYFGLILPLQSTYISTSIALTLSLQDYSLASQRCYCWTLLAGWTGTWTHTDSTTWQSFSWVLHSNQSLKDYLSKLFKSIYF